MSPLLKEVMALCRFIFMQVSINFVWTLLAVDVLMKREGLEFIAMDLLHVYYIVWPKRDIQTHMYAGNHNL